MTTHAPTLSSQSIIDQLPKRIPPHWNILKYGRHVGVQRHPTKGDFWIARVRTVSKGQYKQSRLAPVDFTGKRGIDYEEAKRLAQNWFARPDVRRCSANALPVGTNQELRYAKSVAEFTIGDALVDYVEWKRVAAAKTHFETNLSLINHHIIPRLGDLPVEQLTPRRVTEFMVEVLETPPKYGNHPVGPRRRLANLDAEQLRKRKKTVNTLVGILRLALQMAWENGDFEHERVWRTIRRLPHKDAPRNIFLSRDECRSLLAYCREDLACLVRGALFTGCRVAELVDLCVDDVEPGIRGIYVAPQKNYRGRYVYLPTEGLRFFRSQCEGKASGDQVFLMNSGKTWRGNHKHLFKQAVAAAGLPERFVFHGLRHTYASQLVQAGTPLAVVARQLGHATTDTVSRTYGHLSCESIERELEARFWSLDHPAHNEDKHDLTLQCLRFDAVEKPDPRHSWPGANHSKSTGELPRLLRMR